MTLVSPKESLHRVVVVVVPLEGVTNHLIPLALREVVRRGR